VENGISLEVDGGISALGLAGTLFGSSGIIQRCWFKGQDSTLMWSMTIKPKTACALYLVVITAVFQASSSAQTKPTPAERVRVWEDAEPILTSEEGPPDPNPPFDLFSRGSFYNYPYTLRHNLVDRRVPKQWRTLNLENEYLKCTVLPDLGGHLYTCVDKINGASLFYANPTIKFARIAYRGMWAALGVEFNFPVSHNWMTVSPVDFATTREADGGASVWVGNIDRPYGMQWRVQLTLRPGRAYLEQKTVLYNRSDTRHRFYWWTNAAVEVWDDSRILYPMQFTAAHGFRDIDTWPVNSAGVDQSVVGNHKYGPVSRFSYGSREPYMAVYHPRTNAGVVHYSSALDLPAKKIWSWGSDADGLEWRTALSDNHSAYIEIQAGLFRDQETYGFLDPEESRSFSEYWVPIRDLGGVARANLEAVVNLSRRPGSKGTVDLEVALNVTREFPNASLRLLGGNRTLATVDASLSPRQTFRKLFQGLPSNAAYTVELRSDSGKTVLRHTEGEYDFVPRDEVHVGEQPSKVYPPEANFGADDFVALATDQESNGELLVAFHTYQRGLARFPESISLNRGAGRLQVVLAQYGAAISHLSKALGWLSNDHESAYYLGLAEAAEKHDRSARTHLEFAQQSEDFHGSALMALAELEGRAGNHQRALDLVLAVVDAAPSLTRAGEMEVACLRHLGRQADAKARVSYWQKKDPTDSFLRYEAMKLGATDQALWAHLAGDPQRILEIAAQYMRMGLYGDALDLLSQKYPSGPQVVSEPGTLPPTYYPLIAYYRGYCRYLLGQDGRADFDAASAMPTTYVFPNRAESFSVLRRALGINPEDPTAHFLMGSLYLSAGETGLALDEWEAARRLKPAIPTLHRNLGYTVLLSGGSPQRAIELFREGRKYDGHNVDLYLGLEQAMEKAGQPADERARALQSYPDVESAPAAFVFRLVQVLSQAGEFESAENLLEHRFFPREEGGTTVGQAYVTLRLNHAATLAAKHDCVTALEILRQLQDANATVPFTTERLAQYALSESAKRSMSGVEQACH
jgi:tetratricopeptide (TPR) repeat protein